MKTPIVRLRLFQTFVAGLALLILAVGSVSAPYARDASQDYLGARALRDGRGVFAPIPDLAAIYFPGQNVNIPTPNPHPPVLLLASLPLSYLPYEVIFPALLVVNVLLVVLIGRWLGLSYHGSLALTAWPPLWMVLLHGQLEVLLLVLAMLGWRAADRGDQWRAGLWLGLAGAVKLYPLFLLLPFLLRRQFRVLAGAAGVLVLSQIAALAVVGLDGIIRYLTVIVPAVSARFGRLAMNTSCYGALLRIFGGAEDVEPIIDAPGLVLPVAAVLAILGLVAVARLVPQATPLVSFIALPAAWGYHVTLALPEIGRLLRQSRWRAATLTAAVAASFVQPPLVFFANQIVVGLTGWDGDRAPPVSGLIGAIQTIGIVGLVILSFRARPPTSASPESPV